MTTQNPPPPPKLEALGFCGADDSVNPRHLALLGRTYPLVEWGVLFRPDKAGTPRYASEEWVRRLSRTLEREGGDGGRGAKGGRGVRLAAHLCGSHVNDLLTSAVESSSAEGIDGFLAQLFGWGFRRVQVNATAVNGVYTEQLGERTTMESFVRTTNAHREMEFIVQRNDETEPLWSALLELDELPENVVFLQDESKGTGKEVKGGWPTDGRFVATSRKTVGFAGGIKPSNVISVAESAQGACLAAGGHNFWIDMESGVRTTVVNPNGSREDIFDLAKCFDCIDAICEAGLGSISAPSDEHKQS
ncbi:hypothetical protein ACHAWF_012161 [Thalassiosira exigua]